MRDPSTLEATTENAEPADRRCAELRSQRGGGDAGCGRAKVRNRANCTVAHPATLLLSRRDCCTGRGARPPRLRPRRKVWASPAGCQERSPESSVRKFANSLDSPMVSVYATLCVRTDAMSGDGPRWQDQLARRVRQQAGDTEHGRFEAVLQGRFGPGGLTRRAGGPPPSGSASPWPRSGSSPSLSRSLRQREHSPERCSSCRRA